MSKNTAVRMMTPAAQQKQQQNNKMKHRQYPPNRKGPCAPCFAKPFSFFPGALRRLCSSWILEWDARLLASCKQESRQIPFLLILYRNRKLSLLIKNPQLSLQNSASLPSSVARHRSKMLRRRQCAIAWRVAAEDNAEHSTDTTSESETDNEVLQETRLLHQAQCSQKVVHQHPTNP